MNKKKALRKKIIISLLVSMIIVVIINPITRYETNAAISDEPNSRGTPNTYYSVSGQTIFHEQEGEGWYAVYYDSEGKPVKVTYERVEGSAYYPDPSGQSLEGLADFRIASTVNNDIRNGALLAGLSEVEKNQHINSMAGTIPGMGNDPIKPGETPQDVQDAIDEAMDNTNKTYNLGGVLLDPLLDVLVSLGDTIMNSLQGLLMKTETDSTNIFDIKNYLILSGKVAPEDEGNDSDGNTSQGTTDAQNNSNGNTSQGTTDSGANGSEVKAPDLSEYATYPNAKTTINVDTKEFYYGWLNFKKTFYYINAKYSPEEIFSNTTGAPAEKRIPAFNINYFSGTENSGSGSTGNSSSGSTEGSEISRELNIRPMIAGWYVALRNLSIAGLLVVLVYLGIRILMSSTATDKAKYKQLITDWLIGLCLLFTMHYIMAFTVTIVEAIVNGINNNSTSAVKILEDGNDNGYTTNLVGAARFQTQYKDVGRRMPYVIMYVALVVYTVTFTVFYFKRALMMAFLTMIAPLVAFTYPIDKVTDGKAQAFNAWLREYVYNALLQPFHLIIYTVFVSNALNFAKNNVFYMIASLWFVMKAEQILRGFFGFNKASSTMDALQTVGLASVLGHIAKGGSKLKGAANDALAGEKSNEPIRFNKGADLRELAGGTEGNQGVNQGETANIRTANDALSGLGSDQTANQTDQATNLGGLGEEILGGTGMNTAGQNINLDLGEESTQEQDEWTRLWRTRTARLPRKIGRVAWKGIKGAAKLGVRTTFSAGAGVLAGAIALASGADAGKAIAAASTGIGIGQRAGKAFNNGIGRGINRLKEDGDIFYGDDSANKRRVDKMMYGNEDLFNYVRSSMMAKNNGVVPKSSDVNKEMENYRPFLERGIDVKDAEKAMKVADSMGISGPKNNRNYSEAALMAAAGKQDGVNRTALQKDAEKWMRDTKASLIEGGLTEQQAQMVADKYYSFQERFHGVEDHQVRKNREDKERAEEKQRKEREKGEEVRNMILTGGSESAYKEEMKKFRKPHDDLNRLGKGQGRMGQSNFTPRGDNNPDGPIIFKR